MQEMMAGDPAFEQMLAELVQVLQQAQPQQPPAPMTNDQMAANIQRQSGRFPPNMQVQPPFGTDVLGRRQVEARPRDMSTTELMTNALGDPKWTNAIYNAAPVIDAGPQIAKDTYANTIIEPANALAQFASDPSIPNATNAGVRTALALSPFKPAAALKAAGLVGGLGLTSAVGTDAFNAITKQPVEAADSDPLAQIEKRQREIQARLGQKLTGGERRALEKEASDLSATKSAIMQKSATTNIEAEAATKRDSELRQNKARDVFNTSMHDYEDSRKPGIAMQTINKLGPIAPAVAAMAGGGILRMANRDPSLTRQYVAGLLPAVTVANARPVEGMINEPIENPEVAAYKKASRVLADTDPLKEQYRNEAKALPATNPVREAAANETFDLKKLATRNAIAALEGTGAFLGNDAVNALARLRRAPADLARIPGEMRAARQPVGTIEERVEQQLQTLKTNGPLRGPGGQFMADDDARHMIRQMLTAQQTATPQSPASTQNVLATMARRAALPAAGVGAGYGLSKLFGQ